MVQENDKVNTTHQQTAETQHKTKGRRQRYKKEKGRLGSKGKRGTSAIKFEGGEPGMRGNVFQCREESRSTLQFQKTCKELIRHVSSIYSQHEDIVHLLEKMEEPYIQEPPSPKTTIVKDEDNPKIMMQLEPS